MKLDRTQIAGIILMFVALALGAGVGAAITLLPADTGDMLSFADR